MTPAIKAQRDEKALEYAIKENDRRGFILGHNGETKDAFVAGADWCWEISERLASEKIEELEAYKTITQLNKEIELRTSIKDIPTAKWASDKIDELEEKLKGRVSPKYLAQSAMLQVKFDQAIRLLKSVQELTLETDTYSRISEGLRELEGVK